MFGSSIETCIILLRSNLLTESLNLARISSALVCPKNLESQYTQKLDCWWYARILLLDSFDWSVLPYSGSHQKTLQRNCKFILSIRICWKCRALPKIIKSASLVWLIWNSLAIWVSENIVLNKLEMCSAELAQQSDYTLKCPHYFGFLFFHRISKFQHQCQLFLTG